MVYYGEETALAEENFNLKNRKTNLRLIYCVALVKRAAAMSYKSLGIKEELYEAVIGVCKRIENGEFDDSFVTQALQGGAGTSVNMNVNEVIAGVVKSETGLSVHPIDDVNRGQSTNDVYPTALRIACIQLLRELSDSCATLQESLQKKENEYEFIKKLGRTELMDAVPVTLGEEFGAYAQAIARDRWRLYKAEERLRQVNIGGTAVGNYDTAQRKYRFKVVENLREISGIGISVAEYPMDITQNNDVFVEVSGLLKALAVSLIKISNDLRLMNMNSLGEIKLSELQKGSSIMPGKVNPVIPEMVMQCAMRVMANDEAVSLAASHGEFELNPFLPLIADSILDSLELLYNAVKIFDEKCIATLKADEKRCAEILENSFYFGASFVPKLGYDVVSEIIKSGISKQEALKKLEEMSKENE